ncbi:MAG: regulatory YrvL family protein [Clostridium sp.]|nr:regulatory YrvL family protein [Clostridium sp.]
MKKIFEKYFADGIAKILVITFFVGVIAGIFLLVSMFGGFIMSVFGFKYRSVGSILLFFVIVFILSFPIDLVTEALPKVLLIEFHKINLWQARVLYIVLDTLCSMICYSLVDYFMDSVHASDMAIFMVSLIFSLIEAKDITEKETPKTD